MTRSCEQILVDDLEKYLNELIEEEYRVKEMIEYLSAKINKREKEVELRYWTERFEQLKKE